MEEPAQADTEPEDGEDGRTRRCIATGVVQDAELMVRFVTGPDGQVWPDVQAKLPGRGMWVTASRAALAQAMARKAFARAAKQAVVVPADLPDKVEALLVRRCIDWLGLTKGAGQGVSGFDKVKEWLAARRARVLVQARDGSPDQRRKLSTLAREIPVIALLDGAELSLALGRQNVIHAALSSGRLADRFLIEARRLAGFREPETAAGPQLETE